MILQTQRLILRPWQEDDAAECYRFAQDPRVGPAAGWAPHTRVEDSRQIIRAVLAVPETYAIVLRETGLPIGSIGLHHNDLAAKDDEAELGYWLGVPYWGRGIVPEAAREVLRHAFEDLSLARVWCAYYEGNEKSKRVQQKLGFRYQWTTERAPVPQLGETRRGYVSLLTRAEWAAANGKQAAVLYIYGKGGSAAEAARYRPLFPSHDVIGFAYQAQTPWAFREECQTFFAPLRGQYKSISLIANSLGAFFAMCAGIENEIGHACFISPVVDMERLITDRMRAARVTERKLEKEGTIPMADGEALSWEYLCYVRRKRPVWRVPTEILCGSEDDLVPVDTIARFVREHHARLTVMPGGEHWFHTEAQMQFLDRWIGAVASGEIFKSGEEIC